MAEEGAHWEGMPFQKMQHGDLLLRAPDESFGMSMGISSGYIERVQFQYRWASALVKYFLEHVQVKGWTLPYRIAMNYLFMI
jgi:hypothetical protein